MTPNDPERGDGGQDARLKAILIAADAVGLVEVSAMPDS
jgi:hypothetical protein